MSHLTAPAHAPLAGYRQALPDPHQPYVPTGTIPMAEKIIRFIEELIDAFNFGSSINK